MRCRGYIDPIPSVLPFPSSPFVVGKPAWFSDPPDLHFVEKGLAITLSDVLYRDRKGFMRLVPAGLPHDGMSLPWVAEGIWDRWDIGDRQAVVLHDFTYAAYDSVRSWPVTRQQADKDMLDGFRLNKNSGGDWIRYFVVHVGGYWIWKKENKDKLQEQYFKALEIGPVMLEKWVEQMRKRSADDEHH